MIEIGVSIGYAYKDELNGFSTEGLEATRELLNRDIPEAVEMDEALARVIDAEPGTGIVKELRSEGITLMGAHYDRQQDAPEGLMFAQGFPAEADAFTVVRVGLWIAAAGEVVPLTKRTMHPRTRDEIRKFFLSAGLSDGTEGENGHRWGVPVERMTTIVPLHPQEGDIQERFRYGHRKDLLAIASLDLSDELKGEISTTVRKYHEREEIAAS